MALIKREKSEKTKAEERGKRTGKKNREEEQGKEQDGKDGKRKF